MKVTSWEVVGLCMKIVLKQLLKKEADENVNWVQNYVK
jgi:hypothetical protein